MAINSEAYSVAVVLVIKICNYVGEGGRVAGGRLWCKYLLVTVATLWLNLYLIRIMLFNFSVLSIRTDPQNIPEQAGAGRACVVFTTNPSNTVTETEISFNLTTRNGFRGMSNCTVRKQEIYAHVS